MCLCRRSWRRKRQCLGRLTVLHQRPVQKSPKHRQQLPPKHRHQLPAQRQCLPLQLLRLPASQVRRRKCQRRNWCHQPQRLWPQLLRQHLQSPRQHRSRWKQPASWLPRMRKPAPREREPKPSANVCALQPLKLHPPMRCQGRCRVQRQLAWLPPLKPRLPALQHHRVLLQSQPLRWRRPQQQHQPACQ
jgi:hypothetical protein